MSDTKHIVCPACNAVNRIPSAKLDADPAVSVEDKITYPPTKLKLMQLLMTEYYI